jgi:hypothetical protein
MKKFTLFAVCALIAASAAEARPTLLPFKNPPLAATRLMRVINSQFVTKSTRCRVVNPYRIDCTSRYHNYPAKLVFHKVNPYMLLLDLYAVGQHNVSRMETKVAY